jgi:hypothetical protein
MEENEITRKVVKAHNDGWSWAEIGQKLGVTAAQAERQYGAAVAAAATQFSTHVFNLG